MIELQSISKKYRSRHGDINVLKDVSLKIEKGEKVGIIGRNGAGKSTLIKIISGAERPSTGRVIRNMSVSWPLAFGGAFQGSLTGADNTKFICRIYGTNHTKALPFVRDFSELGRFINEPIKTYSSGMRARLAFAISMAIDFECFLIDEVIAVGDSTFHKKCEDELFSKRRDSAMIIVSHDPSYINNHCSRVLLLEDGEIRSLPTNDVPVASTPAK